MTIQSEAERFLAALEKRCQLAGSSKVSAAQLHALGTSINLSVPDMDAFIEQLNDAGTPVLPIPCHEWHGLSYPPQHVQMTICKGMQAGPAGAPIAHTTLLELIGRPLQGCHIRAFPHTH